MSINRFFCAGIFSAHWNASSSSNDEIEVWCGWCRREWNIQIAACAEFNMRLIGYSLTDYKQGFHDNIACCRESIGEHEGSIIGNDKSYVECADEYHPIPASFENAIMRYDETRFFQRLSFVFRQRLYVGVKEILWWREWWWWCEKSCKFPLKYDLMLSHCWVSACFSSFQASAGCNGWMGKEEEQKRDEKVSDAVDWWKESRVLGSTQLT